MRIVVIIGMLLLPSVAQACIGGNSPEQLAARQLANFQHYDQNKNGRVTLGEFLLTETKNKQSKHVNFHPFIDNDKDKSGDVSLEEWNAFRDANYYLTDGGC